MMLPMRRRRFIFAVALVGIAVKLIEIGVTRHGVGPFEYVTLAALVALLLLTAIRLLRQVREGPA
jgi:hypothetical protein